ncbi:MAG: isocitrate/isopropylmalate dehydrogenase family protein [Rhizobiales bacterium]|nr:isocitrate/isopropylmalate dehydrogenase family protein [Hyphomicrobiales bacterium]
MAISNELRIAVMPGDGIGEEIMAPCLELLELVRSKVGGFALGYDWVEAGAGLYAKTGDALPDAAIKRATDADAILLAAMGLPDVRYPDGREIVPQIDIREILDLYAGVRPVKTFPGMPLPLADERAHNLDLVLIRESTEGLFWGRGKSFIDKDEAHDKMVITRMGTERVCNFAFNLAKRRKAQGHEGRVTCVDKANVLGSMAFFREVFDGCAEGYSDITADYCYVDAMALKLIRNPWDNDVLVTENMFGDILSDAGAALMGGMGLAPSADIGDKHAVFQPCHGTAPDIMGTGKANPTAMILSAAMMLDWLGERHSSEKLVVAGEVLDKAVRTAFAGGDLIPHEMGGNAGLREVTARVKEALGG